MASAEINLIRKSKKFLKFIKHTSERTYKKRRHFHGKNRVEIIQPNWINHIRTVEIEGIYNNYKNPNQKGELI